MGPWRSNARIPFCGLQHPETTPPSQKSTTSQTAPFTLFSYATVQALAGGIAKAGRADPKAVAKTLREITVDTVIGPVTFDQKGDIKDPKYDINVWKGGTYSKLAQ